MKSFLKLLIPILLIMVSGCKLLKKPEEIITGNISVNELKHYKWFNKGYKNYHFDKVAGDSLFGLRYLNICVVGGDWCSDTKLYLPQLIKILKALNFNESKLSIIFVDRTKQSPQGFDNQEGSFDNLNIKFIPTIIFYNDNGKEVGRIVEKPKTTLESDLFQIINQP